MPIEVGSTTLSVNNSESCGLTSIEISMEDGSMGSTLNWSMKSVRL